MNTPRYSHDIRLNPETEHYEAKVVDTETGKSKLHVFPEHPDWREIHRIYRILESTLEREQADEYTD